MTVVATSQPEVIKTPFSSSIELRVFRSIDEIDLTRDAWDEFVQSAQSGTGVPGRLPITTIASSGPLARYPPDASGRGVSTWRLKIGME